MSTTEVERAPAPSAGTATGPGRAPQAAAVALTATAILATAAVFVAAHLFSSFRMYDDEGYMMMTVAHLMGGRALYDEVPTFYGPAYYAARLLLHEGAGISLTGDNVRWITAGFWLVSAALGALVAWRLSRRATAAALAFLGVVAHLVTFSNEPGHPQDLATTLTLALAAAATWADARRAVSWAAAMGGLVAWLVLVKVNLGAYAGLAVLLATASATPGRAARAASLGLSLIAAILPLVLMRGALGQPRWLPTAASMSLAVLAASIMALAGRRPLTRRPAVLATAMLVGGVAAALPPVLLVMARGTSPIGLAEGIVLGPMRLGSMDMGYKGLVFPIGVAWAAASAIAAAAVGLGRWELPAGRRADAAAAAIKGAFGLAVILPRLFPHWATIFLLYNAALPLSWLVLAPPRSDAPGSGAGPTLGRRTLALLAPLMALQIFPVAGSQRDCGSVLLLPIAAACLADAIDRAVRLAAPGAIIRRALSVALPGASAAALGMLAWWAASTVSYYRSLSPPGDALRGRGVDLVRFPERDAATLQWLAANLSRHADAFQCSSGLNSLYSWTGLPSPTTVVVGNSLGVCPDDRQRAIVRALKGHPRAVAIYKPSYFDVRKSGDRRLRLGDATVPLLVAFRDQYASCGSVDGYDFRVRRGRPLPELVDCARRAGPGRDASAVLSPAGPSEARRAQVVDPSSRAVLADTRPGPGVAPMRVVADGPPAALPADGDGTGIDLSAGRRLTLVFPGPAPDLSGDALLLRLLGPSGEVLRSIPFLNGAPPDGEGG